ncbi:MAG: hypothetical protein R3C59_15665 [Planctomycetaceae bacterium]
MITISCRPLICAAALCCALHSATTYAQPLSADTVPAPRKQLDDAAGFKDVRVFRNASDGSVLQWLRTAEQGATPLMHEISFLTLPIGSRVTVAQFEDNAPGRDAERRMDERRMDEQREQERRHDGPPDRRQHSEGRRGPDGELHRGPDHRGPDHRGPDQRHVADRLPDHRNPDDWQQRVHALHEAAERLDHGGLNDMAHELRRQAEQIEREFHSRGNHHDETLQELMHNVSELRREVREVHERLDVVLKQLERVAPEPDPAFRNHSEEKNGEGVRRFEGNKAETSGLFGVDDTPPK